MSLVSLHDRRRDVADALYQAYDFGPYTVDECSGWSYLQTDAATDYTLHVYIGALSENDIGGAPTDRCIVTVRFENESAVVQSISASLNGEEIGKPGPVEDGPSEPSVSPVDALTAIMARIDGVYDHPELMKFGPLSVDTTADIARIAKAGLTQASA